MTTPAKRMKQMGAMLSRTKEENRSLRAERDALRRERDGWKSAAEKRGDTSDHLRGQLADAERERDQWKAKFEGKNSNLQRANNEGLERAEDLAAVVRERDAGRDALRELEREGE